MEHVDIYTDGSCHGNPGRGGCGVILVFSDDCYEISYGYRYTTYNRMELMACIAGLEELEHAYSVTIYTDSKYLVDCITKGWAMSWMLNDWRRSNGSFAENTDLWERLLSLMQKHKVKFVWVKGHNGHPENERCNQLANAAARGSRLLEDTEYTSHDFTFYTD